MTLPELPDGFRGKHEGNVRITQERFELVGMIVGDVSVCEGGTFICRGMVIGNVYVDDDSSAIIRGMVLGNVAGAGSVEISGMVQSHS